MFLLAFGALLCRRRDRQPGAQLEGFWGVSNAVILPLYFTSELHIPLDLRSPAQTKVVYPEWLVTLVEINPLTYAVDSFVAPSSISTSSIEAPARS